MMRLPALLQPLDVRICNYAAQFQTAQDFG
jgi:hypothetical protein